MKIAVLGTLDSKGQEHAFVAERIRALGHQPVLIDVGTGGDPEVKPDYSRFEVTASAGIDLQALMDRKDRGECVGAMAAAAPDFVAGLVAEGRIDGIISLGGGGGTAIGTAVMRALPFGLPKLMVSTLASGNTAHYVGTSDLIMMPSIVDVAGLNRISRNVFTRAAAAVCGMAEAKEVEHHANPLVVASMFGNTTECVGIARKVLEDAGYEVLVFHATGTGGQTMESLIESGMVAGVLDLTTTEWADEVVGATLSAGPARLDGMSKAGIPAVIAPGCVDMANFGERDTLPDEFKDRTIYIHNPQVTLLRTNPEENAAIGKVLAEKASANPAPTAILNPRGGVSVIACEGQPFYDPDADACLFDAIWTHATCEVIDYDVHINHPDFARACANKLLEFMARTNGSHQTEK